MRSPAPLRLSRPWTWALAAALCVVMLGGLGLATAPAWGEPWVRAEIERKLEAKLGLEVSMERLELAWGTAYLEGLQLRGEDVELRFDRVWVVLEDGNLWRGHVVLDRVDVEGGRVGGERRAWERLRERVQADPPAPAAGGGEAEPAGHRWVPETLRWSGLQIDARDDSREARLTARARGDARPRERRAAVMLEELRADLGHGPSVVAASLRTDLQAGDDGFPVRVWVDDAGAQVTDRVALAGVDGWVEISDPALREVRVDLEGSFSSESTAGKAAPKLWSVAGHLRRDLTAGSLNLEMEAFELGRVPEVLEDLPVVDSTTATAGGHVAVAFADGVARLEGDVHLSGLNVDHPTLARTVVEDLGFDLEFAAEVDPRARRLVLHYADLEREGVKVQVAGEVRHPDRVEGRKYRLHLQLPEVPCQRVLAAIPTALVPSLAGFELAGKFDAEVEVDIDYADLESLRLEGAVGIDRCRAVAVPPQASPQRLAGGFTHQVRMPDGRTQTLALYPGSSTFTPFEEISPNMVQAVLTTEDGGFWRHRGFLPSQFAVALRRNLGSGSIELGASTITMQMVKNLLLAHERTLARKLQEMFLAWYVETVLTKQRIMELYLNEIEYGPGIYGITQAAAHYFGKHPSELTPPEAVYLALMLPSPVRRHVHYCRGSMSDRFAIKHQRIMQIMRERERLSELSYQVYKDVPVVFDLAARGSEAACLAEIDRVLAGEQTQMALTGLLGPGLDPLAENAYYGAGRGARARVERDRPEELDAPGRPAMDRDAETW